MIAKIKSQQQGFTLTELMFAMVFIAFMLVFIASTIVQVTKIYNKGLTLRTINQTGRQVNEDFSRTLRYANATKFATDGYNAAKKRVCANGVTYAWNTVNTDGSLTTTNQYSGSDIATPLKLIRIEDRDGSLCRDISLTINKSKATELLGSQLGIQHFAISFNNDTKLIRLRTVISTIGDNRPQGTYGNVAHPLECSPGSDGDFCAFGEFLVTVYIRK